MGAVSRQVAEVCSHAFRNYRAGHRLAFAIQLALLRHEVFKLDREQALNEQKKSSALTPQPAIAPANLARSSDLARCQSAFDRFIAAARTGAGPARMHGGLREFCAPAMNDSQRSTDAPLPKEE